MSSLGYSTYGNKQNKYTRKHKHFNHLKKTLHTNVIIGNDEKDLDAKINKIVNITGIPKEMYIDRPLVGIKEKVFDTIDEFSSVECEYLIAYIPDIVWGDTLNILSEVIES